MSDKISRLLNIHSLSYSLWKHTKEPSLEDVCHHTLEGLLNLTSPTDPKIQRVIIKNCTILSYRREFEPIKILLSIFQEDVAQDGPSLTPLINRLQLMIAC